MKDVSWKIADKSGAIILRLIAGGVRDLEDALLERALEWTLLAADEDLGIAVVST